MYTCNVCYYDRLEQPLWDEKEGYPTHSVCLGYGFESGYDDDVGMTIEEYRKEWTRLGAHWVSLTTPKPIGWDWRKQLKNINVSID